MILGCFLANFYWLLCNRTACNHIGFPHDAIICVLKVEPYSPLLNHINCTVPYSHMFWLFVGRNPILSSCFVFTLTKYYYWYLWYISLEQCFTSGRVKLKISFHYLIGDKVSSGWSQRSIPRLKVYEQSFKTKELF